MCVSGSTGVGMTKKQRRKPLCVFSLSLPSQKHHKMDERESMCPSLTLSVYFKISKPYFQIVVCVSGSFCRGNDLNHGSEALCAFLALLFLKYQSIDGVLTWIVCLYALRMIKMLVVLRLFSLSFLKEIKTKIQDLEMHVFSPSFSTTGMIKIRLRTCYIFCLSGLWYMEYSKVHITVACGSFSLSFSRKAKNSTLQI